MEVYTSDSSDSESRELKTLNYSRLQLTPFTLEVTFLNLYPNERRYGDIETILLSHNQLRNVPVSICRFNNLRILDLSSNNLSSLPDFLTECPLTSLIAKNNQLTNESLPKSLLSKTGLMRELNLSGNHFTHFPEQILELRGLKYLYLGGNKIKGISKDIWKVQRYIYFIYEKLMIFSTNNKLWGPCMSFIIKCVYVILAKVQKLSPIKHRDWL